MKKLLLFCLFFFSSLSGVWQYFDIFETPQNKSLNLLGIDHRPYHKRQELDLLLERLKEEEQKGKINILYEGSEEFRIFEREGGYEAHEILANFSPAALKAGLKTIPENIEIRKLVAPWQKLFKKNSDPQIKDIPLIIEKELFQIEDDPKVSFDPSAGFNLNGNSAQEIRNAYRRCLGKSYDEVMLNVMSIKLLDLTWQHVLDEFDKHKKMILDLCNSMKVGPEKNAFKKEIEEKQEKIKEALVELQKRLKPNDRLLDFAIECEKEGKYNLVCHKIYRLGMDIFSAYFDLHLMYKVLLTESDKSLKTFVITGAYHTFSLGGFLANANLNYKYLFCHIERDEQGDPKTVDDKYFDYLNMSVWQLKYFPVSMLNLMISLRNNFSNTKLGLEKLFCNDQQNVTNQENHLVAFLCLTFPRVAIKLQEHLPRRFDACFAVQAEDFLNLHENPTEKDLKEAYSLVTDSLLKKKETLSEDVFQKVTTLVRKVYETLEVQIKLNSCFMPDTEKHTLEEHASATKDSFKMYLFNLL